MRSITTKSGFSCEIDEAVFNDMELFDALTALDGGDMSVLPTVVSKVMGPNKKALYGREESFPAERGFFV